MELLNIQAARAVWLFDIAELNPRGKSIMPDLLEWMKENYHFEKSPSSITDLDVNSKALVFERGQFQVKEEIFINIELKIFNDGFVAETQSSTHESEAFLEDGLQSIAKEFSLYFKPEMIRMKLYGSEVYVRSDRSLVGINPNLSNFISRITSLVPGQFKIQYEMTGISCLPLPGHVPDVSFTPFRFERKLKTLPSEKKFYSSAPLHTEDHLKLLDEFEELLMV
jgi:hypothetical protein